MLKNFKKCLHMRVIKNLNFFNGGRSAASTYMVNRSAGAMVPAGIGLGTPAF